jgi:hypothetical protein
MIGPVPGLDLKAGVDQSPEDDSAAASGSRIGTGKVVAVENIDEHVLRGELGRDR